MSFSEGLQISIYTSTVSKCIYIYIIIPTSRSRVITPLYQCYIYQFPIKYADINWWFITLNHHCCQLPSSELTCAMENWWFFSVSHKNCDFTSGPQKRWWPFRSRWNPKVLASWCVFFQLQSDHTANRPGHNLGDGQAGWPSSKDMGHHGTIQNNPCQSPRQSHKGE